MSDSTGNNPYGGGSDQPQQPPAYPPAQQNPYGQQPSDQGSTTGQPQQPFGQPAPSEQGYGQPAYGQAYPQPAYGQPAYGQSTGDPDKRPGTVTAAGIITIVLSGIVLVLLGFVLAALGVARDEVVDQMRGEPGLGDIDPNDLVSVLFVMFGAFLAWCALAIVLAIFAMRRSNGARIGLVVSSALAALLSLLAITSGFAIITLLGAITVIVLLFTGGAGQWYSRQGAAGGRGGMASPVA